MQVAIGDWEIDLAYAIVDVANQLERIADALESCVYEDDEDDENEDDDEDEEDGWADDDGGSEG